MKKYRYDFFNGKNHDGFSFSNSSGCKWAVIWQSGDGLSYMLFKTKGAATRYAASVHGIVEKRET